jgi:hypothetical protein
VSSAPYETATRRDKPQSVLHYREAVALPRSGSGPKPTVAVLWRLSWEMIWSAPQPQRGCVFFTKQGDK